MRPWSRSWPAYRNLLLAAQDRGYAVLSLDTWLARRPEERCLVLRHDVDQQPASAVRMAEIEATLGVTATWYFRWRTARADVVRAVAAAGGTVGLHYETLSRVALERGVPAADDALVRECRELLRREISAFRERFGETRSICPHGDTRAPGIQNLELLRGQDPREFGVEFDGNEALRGVPLGAWLTDRRGGARWKDDADPLALMAAGVTPLVAVIHPNNWTSRVDAGIDRVLRAVVPPAMPWPVRSGRDEPPL